MWLYCNGRLDDFIHDISIMRKMVDLFDQMIQLQEKYSWEEMDIVISK